MNPFVIARFALLGVSKIGIAIQRRSRERQIETYGREAPKLHNRAEDAAKKFGWEVSQEEVENAIAFLLEQSPEDPLSVLRVYVETLEKGIRYPSDPGTLALAGYRYRRSNGKSLTTADQKIANGRFARSFFFLLGAVASAGAIILSLRSNNLTVEVIGFLASCGSLVYCLGRAVHSQG